MQQWRNEQINSLESAFARWLLLLPANKDEQLIQTLEYIVINQDSSFRQAEESKEKH
ncbi:hypothetical protein [Bacillus anthracis]|uniref:hypothetical protein n=1 Tax=Bacillus cereus group TaxID=86661 RepID=UPI0015932185